MYTDTTIWYSDQHLETMNVYHTKRDCPMYQTVPYQHRRETTAPNTGKAAGIVYEGSRYTLQPCATCASN